SAIWAAKLSTARMANFRHHLGYRFERVYGNCCCIFVSVVNSLDCCVCCGRDRSVCTDREGILELSTSPEYSAMGTVGICDLGLCNCRARRLCSHSFPQRGQAHIFRLWVYLVIWLRFPGSRRIHARHGERIPAGRNANGCRTPQYVSCWICSPCIRLHRQ